MTFFDEVKQQVEEFCEKRESVMGAASLPEQSGDIDLGTPPFVIEVDGCCYAVVFANGDASPLPFGYILDDNDINLDEGETIYCRLSLGGGIKRFIPVIDEFKIPGEDAFCMESAEDSDTWQVVEEGLEEFQQIINGLARTNFIESFAFGVSKVQEIDEIESLDQAMSAILPLSVSFCFSSYTKALQKLKDDNPQFDNDDD